MFKNKLLIFVLLCFVISIIGILNVKANIFYDKKHWPDCVNNGSCIAMCGYTNTIDYNNDVDGIRSSYIYYDLNQKVYFVLFGANEAKMRTLNVDYNDVKFVKDKSTYFGVSAMLDNGICPNYSYIDIKGSSYEVCFDNNYFDPSKEVSNCEKYENNWGTKFDGRSSLEFNFQPSFDKKIEDFFTYSILATTDCSEFTSSNKLIDNILDRVNEAFTTDFLHGNDIPIFIINSNSYKNKNNFIKKAVSNFSELCINQISESETMTDEQKQDYIKGLTCSDDDLDNTLNNLDDIMNKNIGRRSGPVNCDGILDPDVQKLFKNILNLIKYFGPVLVIALTIFDLIKTSVSGEQDELKKISSKFIKRLIAAALLFFMPILIKLLFDLFRITIPDCGTLAIIYLIKLVG